MGKFNLQTSKKRVTPGEPEAPVPETVEVPDEVSTTLSRFSDHLTANASRYAAGLVVLLVAAGAFSWWWASRRTKAAENSTVFVSAIDVALGTVKAHAATEATLAPPAEGKKAKEPAFETDDAKWKAAAEALGKVQGDLTGARAETAVLLKARIDGATGKAGDAAKAYADYLGKNPDSSLGPLALENQGHAAAAAGDAAGAVAAFEKLATSEDLYFKLRGQMLLGDLNNPAMGGKDAAKARTHYDQALTTLTPADGTVFNQSLRTLRGEIARRKAQL
ncbi:MAG: hypothetical protein IV100_22605 [Myxococcales bacterium]|nr:hypothetical protein [Myxococcales bacterium]